MRVLPDDDESDEEEGDEKGAGDSDRSDDAAHPVVSEMEGSDAAEKNGE